MPANIINAKLTKTASTVISRAVIIVGPPWPRSGTARVMQNQIAYYRNRGYFTVLVCVPIHSSFTETHSDWHEIKLGMRELGADRTFFAPIDSRRFVTAKYTAWVRHAFRGTALDWIVFTAKSAQLPDDAIHFIHDLQVDLIHVNHVFTLSFARRLLRLGVRSGHRVPMILETHDVQSQLLQDRGEINPWTHRHDTLERLLHSEIAHLNKVKVLVHCSVDDFHFFKQRLPHKQHVLAMPTIDESFVAAVNVACQSSDDPIDLLFVGQSTDFNRAAIKWFFEQVWPLIADHAYVIKIIGPIDKLVRKDLPDLYQAFRSCFVGPIAELAPAYRAARCVFAPMVSGTGISIKTIEALALGKPFVGTSKAYRGMPMDLLEQAGLQAHDTPQDFADAIVRALSAEQLAAAASRAAYVSLFSNRAAFSSRDAAFKIAAAS
jgi:glycosyltransferase involved in cell wall biosynthesis